MKLPPELEFERPTLEEKYDRAVPGYMKRIADLYAAQLRVRPAHRRERPEEERVEGRG